MQKHLPRTDDLHNERSLYFHERKSVTFIPKILIQSFVGSRSLFPTGIAMILWYGILVWRGVYVMLSSICKSTNDPVVADGEELGTDWLLAMDDK